MSGDDDSMEEILGKIRKIAAEDEGKKSKNPEPDKEMSPSGILHEIHSIIDEAEGTETDARREGRPGDRDTRFRRRALFVVLTGGLACWSAVRWATRSESLWRNPEADAREGDTG